MPDNSENYDIELRTRFLHDHQGRSQLPKVFVFQESASRQNKNPMSLRTHSGSYLNHPQILKPSYQIDAIFRSLFANLTMFIVHPLFLIKFVKQKTYQKISFYDIDALILVYPLLTKYF